MAVKGTLKSNGNEILIKQNQIEGLKIGMQNLKNYVDENFLPSTGIGNIQINQNDSTIRPKDGDYKLWFGAEDKIYYFEDPQVLQGLKEKEPFELATKGDIFNAQLGGTVNADSIYLRLDGENIDDFVGINTNTSIANIDEDGSINDVKQLKDYFEIDEFYSLTGKVKKAVEADKLISKTGYIDDISLSEIFEQDNNGKATNKVKYAIETGTSELVKGISNSVYAVVTVPGLYVYSITDSGNSRQFTALLNIVDLSKDSKTCVDFFIGTINGAEGTFLACTLTYKADTGKVELWSNEKVGNNYVLDNICRRIMKY